MLAFALTACAPTATNFTASALEQAPSMNVQIPLQTSLPKLNTFYVLPYEKLLDPSKEVSIQVEHTAFQVRNYMELLGYKFVSDKKDADIEVIVSASNEYSQTYISPTQYSAPVYVTGQTAQVSTNTSGNFSYTGTQSGYGNYYGNTTATVALPGYYTSATYTLPGRTVGYYYPTISIGLYDTKDSKKLAYISGTGTSKNPDLRVAIQTLLYQGFSQLPLSAVDKPTKNGKIGIGYAVWTTDGNSYYPILLGVEDGFPAKSAGLMAGDFILSIDGVSLKNFTARQVDEMISADRGVTRKLLVNRGRDTLSVELTWAPRP